MHEMSLCENLIQTIEDQADIKHFNTVKTVHLEIGVFAGVEIESLRFCFDVSCRNTIADCAQLVITQLPAKIQCNHCHKESLIYDRLSPCPYCNSVNLHYYGGDEMRITELEVE